MGLHRITTVSLLMAAVGCSTAPPPRTPGMEAMGVEMTAGELRLELYRYESLFASTVHTTADEIANNASLDMPIRETAIRWKINSIPGIQSAVFQFDPLSGLADAFGFTAQMEHFFAQGAGKDLFGEQQHLAINASRILMSEIEALAVRVVGQQRVDEVRPELDAWVKEYPIQNIAFGRRSIAVDAASITAAEWGSGGLRSVGQIEDLVRDLSDRLTIYGEQVPELARWHSELLAIEADRNLITPLWEDVSTLSAAGVSVDETLEGIQAFVEATPELLASERALILDAVRAEMERALADVDRQRRDVLAAVSAERATVMTEIDTLRSEVVEDVERVRIAATTDLDALIERQVQRLASDADRLVDRAFWRALILIGVGLVGLAIVLRWTRKAA